MGLKEPGSAGYSGSQVGWGYGKGKVRRGSGRGWQDLVCQHRQLRPGSNPRYNRWGGGGHGAPTPGIRFSATVGTEICVCWKMCVGREMHVCPWIDEYDV